MLASIESRIHLATSITHTSRRRPYRWLALILLGSVSLEVAGFAGLALLERMGIGYVPADHMRLTADQRRSILDLVEGRTRYFEHSPNLGWRIRSGGRAPHWQANRAGMRSRREYDAAVPVGRVRVGAFGDSFTHDDAVQDDATWAARLEALDPRLEVLNCGVPGYGLDQAYLAFEERAESLAFDIVLIGVMNENAYRTLSVFRPFYRRVSGLPLAKPRFRLQDGALSLIRNPLPRLEDYRELLDDEPAVLARLGAMDGHYQRLYQSGPLDVFRSVRLAKIAAATWRQRFSRERIVTPDGLNPDSEAFALLAAQVVSFARAVARRGALPVVLWLHDRWSTQKLAARAPGAFGPLIDRVHRLGIEAIDAAEALPLDTLDAAFSSDGHYLAPVQERLARLIQTRLAERGLLVPGEARRRARALSLAGSGE